MKRGAIAAIALMVAPLTACEEGCRPTTTDATDTARIDLARPTTPPCCRLG